MNGGETMATNSAPKTVEFMCSHCGKKTRRPISQGRPQPGKCPRKQGDKPHTWVVNKKF